MSIVDDRASSNRSLKDLASEHAALTPPLYGIWWKGDGTAAGCWVLPAAGCWVLLSVSGHFWDTTGLVRPTVFGSREDAENELAKALAKYPHDLSTPYEVRPYP